MGVYLFTGFPGFLAQQLLKGLIKRDGVKKIYLLVLPSNIEHATEVISSIQDEYPTISLQIIEGDITKDRLKIHKKIQKKLMEEVNYVFHLAAIYDLAVKQDMAYRINVIGTKNVLHFVKEMKQLKRFVYYSSAFIAGLREGKVYAHELDVNQQFRNHYEETKFWGEVEVQREMEHIPTTILRPSIVIGDSKTGQTTKFDGPYMLLQFLHRLKYLPNIPYLHKDNVELNVVPVDYIVEASLFLVHQPNTEGKSYHLTNPNPVGTKDTYRMFMKELLNKKPIGTIPFFLIKALLSFSFIRKWLKVEKEAVDYFTCKTNFDCTSTLEALKETTIKCPHFNTFVGPIVHFFQQNMNDPTKQMKIK